MSRGFFSEISLHQELWKLATELFIGKINVTNRRFILFGRKQWENEGREHFYGALSDLSRGLILTQRKNQLSGTNLSSK